MKHTDECLKAQAEWRNRDFQFNLIYPYHCNTCGGEGYFADGNECKCVRTGICPLCAGRIYTTNNIHYCAGCGWSSNMGTDVPKMPACSCDK